MGSIHWLVKVMNTETNELFEGDILNNEYDFEYRKYIQDRGNNELDAERILLLLKEENVIDDDWIVKSIKEENEFCTIDFEAIKDASDRLEEVYEYNDDDDCDDDDGFKFQFNHMVDGVELFNKKQEEKASKYQAVIVWAALKYE